MATIETPPERQQPHADEPETSSAISPTATPPATTPTTPTTPTTTTPTTPTTPTTRRPQPTFGEYAPEGWEWKPEESGQAGTASVTPADRPAAHSTSGTIAGVPHNLGAAPGHSGASGAPAHMTHPDKSTESPSVGDPAPYRATVAPAEASVAAPVPALQGAATPQPRTGDRIVTVLLLAFGALGALIMAQSMMGLGSSFAMVAEALEITDFRLPAWVNTLGTVSALAFFAVYAAVLIFSIRRMRARKITFWVPLTAGVVVLIATIAIPGFAMMAIPELMQAASDPDAFQKLLDYSLTTNP